ncbi:MAG: peptidoglycan-binding protein [Firmicutes bacterium]|nr:peptidoglycan-binding protein [Bacillota bacterium]
MNHFKKLMISCVLSGVLVLVSPLYILQANAFGLLKNGVSGTPVKEVQLKLKNLGYFNHEATGYYGPITEKAVKAFQTDYSIKIDGIVGPQTLNMLDRHLKPDVSRASAVNREALMPWFGQAEHAFPIGAVATITDVQTGLAFKAKRTYGYNHADCETLTANDTEIFKQIFGGAFNWQRRAIILEYGEYKLAASMAGMPHAGREDKATNAWVANRSAGFGTGHNLDAVKKNNMSGHFDVHFLGSKTHGTNSIDNKHQNMVKEAAKAIK